MQRCFDNCTPKLTRRYSISPRLQLAYDVQDMELQRALSSMNLLHGVATEKTVEFPDTVFQSASLLRDTRPHGEGLTGVDSLAQEVMNARVACQKAFKSCEATTAASPKYKEECATRFKSFNQAANIDEEVVSSLESIRPSLELLAGPHEELRRALPSKSLVDGPATNTEAQERLTTLVEKANHMSKLRKGLMDEMRKQVWGGLGVEVSLMLTADP